MFSIYTEKEIFEDIIVSSDKYPHWSNICRHHADVHVNLTNVQLDAELQIQDSPLFLFTQLNGGRTPIPQKDYFDELYQNNEAITQHPRSAFFLKYSKTQTDQLQTDYGMVVQSGENIDDNILRASFYKELVVGDVLEEQGSPDIGWQYLIKFPLAPSNAMVITDRHLFSNEERQVIVGERNVIRLVHALLPANLQIPYHITIIAEDNGKPTSWCTNLVGRLQTAIHGLRTYPIVLEMVFSKTIHKRKIFLNYATGTCDKGFAVFRTNDDKTVRDSNDFSCDRIFVRSAPGEGDTEFKASAIKLAEIKRTCISVKQFIDNQGPLISNFRILGDCKADRTLHNRLINDA